MLSFLCQAMFTKQNHPLHLASGENPLETLLLLFLSLLHIKVDILNTLSSLNLFVLSPKHSNS